MKRIIAAIGFALAATSASAAEETLRDFSWVELQREGKQLPGEVSPAGGAESFETIKLSDGALGARLIPLLTIDSPGITQPTYALRGQVRCEGVEGVGYLEMWSYFSGGGRYFSRTLDPSGPMGYLSGTQSWRPFEVYFRDTTGGPMPFKLEFKLALPEKGTVWLSGVRLAQIPDPDLDARLKRRQSAAPWKGSIAAAPELGRIKIVFFAMTAAAICLAGLIWAKRDSRTTAEALAWVFLGSLAVGAAWEILEVASLIGRYASPNSGAWWSDEAAGLVGGGAGGLLGLCGAMIGTLTSSGVGRKIVLGTLLGMLALGGLCFVFGVLALVASQPYAVCYPLLLIGAMMTGTPIWFIPLTRKRYEEMELRRMSAMDAGG